MADLEEIWVPLVDEPIGSIVARIQEQNADIDRLVASPRRVLAFRTFAYIRVGLVLGQLLFDHDLPPYDGSETWVDALLRDPEEQGGSPPNVSVAMLVPRPGGDRRQDGRQRRCPGV